MSLKPLHNSPETGEVQASGISSAPESTIKDTSGRISELLLLEDRQNLSNSQNQFKSLLSQFEAEVKRISDEIGYDYDLSNYSTKLAQYDKNMKLVIKKLFKSYPTLASLYNEIKLICDGMSNGDIIIQGLHKEYLFDLLYEYLDYGTMESFKNFAFDFGEKYMKVAFDKYENDRKNFIKNSGKLRGLKVWKYRLEDVSEKELNFVFSHLSHLEYFDFGGVNFNKFSINQLECIFNSFINIKQLGLSRVSLSSIDLQRLGIIFGNLGSVKIINIGLNDLSESQQGHLDIIFKNLVNIKAIDLSKNHLGLLDRKCLTSIFSYLTNVRYIHLCHSDFGILDYDSLDYIFSNLKNARVINLMLNDLYKLNQDSLKCIFTHLKGAKKICLDGNSFSDKQISFINGLLPYTKISY